MKFTPHKFQQDGIDHAVEFLRNAKQGDKQLYYAPTGAGKSIIELAIQSQLEDCWIVTPREEIADGMLDKLGHADADMLDHYITTPIRMRNALLAGKMARRPKYLIFDESHHHEAESWQQLSLLTGLAPSIGFTASPYRGSPKSTREFLESWGPPRVLISFRDAVRQGYIALPSFTTLPLVDDDIVEVSGGEFKVTSIEAATVDRLGDLAEQSRPWYSDRWDVPTVYSMPSSACCIRLREELARRGMPSVLVTADTPKDERRLAFDATVDRITALLHINIVTEGVDFQFRRLVDASPTMSPVKWVQQLGRITRPGEGTPMYVCTNRNLSRHAYVLEGAVPTHSIVENVDKFPPSQRASARVLGMEAIGRFKPTNVKLNDGITLTMYSLSVQVDSMFVEYCCIAHPACEAVWAAKVNTVKDGQRAYGKWARVEPPKELSGFQSMAPRELSPKQRGWWERSAASFGLDPTQKVDRKNFPILPLLLDLGLRF